MLDILGRRTQTFISVGGMVVTLYMIGGLMKSEFRLQAKFVQIMHQSVESDLARIRRKYQPIRHLRYHRSHFPLPGLLRLRYHAHD